MSARGKQTFSENFRVRPRLCENFFALTKAPRNAHQSRIFLDFRPRNSKQRTLAYVLFSTWELLHGLDPFATSGAPETYTKL